MRSSLVLVLFLALASSAHAAPAEVAFSSSDGLYSMRADGSERHRLVAGEYVGDPAWSPDGARLAYVEGGRIVIDGRPIASSATERSHDSGPTWSADGRMLVFSRALGSFGEQNQRSQLVLYDTALATERVLLEQFGSDVAETSIGLPRFSPDGSTVAYSRSQLDDEQSYQDDVFTIPVVGGMPKLLLHAAIDAVWSPDGTRLAYASVKDHNGGDGSEVEGSSWSFPELYVAAGDGSGARRLTTNQGSDGSPAWSPDGSRILFASDQNLPSGDSTEVYSVAPDGSCLTWITNGTPGSSSPSFRPGSGDSFDPGSCNPADHPARPGAFKPRPVSGGLWLGPRFDGLLASRESSDDGVEYGDCERFEAKRCPTPIDIGRLVSCRPGTWDHLGDFTFTRRRGGAVLAYGGRYDRAVLFHGSVGTTIMVGDVQTTRARVTQVAAALRPYAASKPGSIDAPRVPRALAHQIERTAEVVDAVGRSAAAKRLKLSGRTVAAHLRLRPLLRPYRFCD